MHTPQQEGDVRMTTLNSTYGSTSSSRIQRWDATPSDVDWCYGTKCIQHTQENQLAPSLLPEGGQVEQLQEHYMPRQPVQQPRYLHQDLSIELENMRQERNLLQQTQQRMSSDLFELRAV